MHQSRLAPLEQAVEAVCEQIRLASQPHEVVVASIEPLGRAARSEWAAYWKLDPALQRVQRLATWSASGLKLHSAGDDAQRHAASLGRYNAAHVWRTGKPLWATALVLARTLPSPADEQSEPQRGVWFALKTDAAVYGVVELLGRTFSPRTPLHLSTIERIGCRLGDVLAQRQLDRAPSGS